MLAEYNVTSVEDLPVNFSGIALQAGEEYGNTISDKHYERLWQAYERQNRVHEMAAVVAPLIAIRNVSMGLAGTDWAQHKDFARAAEEYRRVLNKQMNEKYTHNSRAGQMNYVADRRLWEQAPPFAYQAPGLAWVLGNHVWGLMLLIVWCAGASAAAIVAASRMRVD